MIEAIVQAIRVEKVGVKRLAKKAGLGDRAVTALLNGGDAMSAEDLVKLYRVAEDLATADIAEDEQLANF